MFWWRYAGWRFHTTAHWCWKDGRVIKAQVSTGYSLASFTFWSWAGIAEVVKGGCVGCKYVYRRPVGHFKICVAGLWPIANEFPFVAFTLRGDGTYWFCYPNGACLGTKGG